MKNIYGLISEITRFLFIFSLWMSSLPVWADDDHKGRDSVREDVLTAVASYAANAVGNTLPGGAGVEINFIYGQGGTRGVAQGGAALATVGRVKMVARPFHDRLIEVGLEQDYPWTDCAQWRDDSALATWAHLEEAFGFVLGGQVTSGPVLASAGRLADGRSEPKVAQAHSASASTGAAGKTSAQAGTAITAKSDGKAVRADSPQGAQKIRVVIDYPVEGEKL